MSYQISDTNLCIGESFSITNNSIFADTHQWSYGSSSINTESPSNILGLVGINSLVYISGNPNNTCYDTSTLNIIVQSGPILNFSVNEVFGCDSLIISISDSSLNTNNYLYDFGDGSTSSAQNPNHTYSNPGIYTITLVGEDSTGCQQTLNYSDTIKIDIKPVINFLVSDSNFCLNSSFTINNNSLNTSYHQWTYASQTYNDISPTIIANLIGSNPLQYILSLIHI